ncbi:MAG: aminoacyl-tRNA hydrolase [Lachnospiraceae bacterium]|nr:aminoacyl-tRNA hydrolase [Lachnospiraceae bacterium]
MILLVGLGNPKREYVGTRHNIGFMAIDAIAKKYQIDVTTSKHKALIGKGVIGGQKVILAKPVTFMNLSGESVRELVDYYKVDEESELIVLYDDVSLEPGKIRLRKKGSPGGHNGIKNIIAHLGHDVFWRVKIGVGEKPKGYDLADYVLGHFSKEEIPVLEDALRRAADAVEMMITDGIDVAMNRFN